MIDKWGRKKGKMKKSDKGTTVFAKQRKTQVNGKLGPYGFRVGTKYDQVARIAGQKPRDLDDLVNLCVKKTGISANCVLFDIRVLCDPNNKSNKGKTKNKFGHTTERVHIRAL